MIGIGIFINTIPLAKQVGPLGLFSYMLIGLIMMPLIISISRLTILYPAGGFYTYGAQEISPLIGFISGWSYFVAKLASVALMMHVSTLFIQELIPTLRSLNPFIIDVYFLCLFIGLNMLHIKTGSLLQAIFVLLKISPLLFLTATGTLLFKTSNIISQSYAWSSIPGTLPIVLFSLLGFEGACSLSSKIENPERNASRAILVSYGIIVTLCCVYQLIMYGIFGSFIATFKDYRDIFPHFFSLYIPDSPLIGYATTACHIAIASSALSAAYSIIFSNSWNLYALAQHNHLFLSKKLVTLNRYHTPWLCVIVQGVIVLIHWIVSQASQLPLQITGALGCTIAYSISVFSFFRAMKKHNTLAKLILPMAALGSCALLLILCTYNLYLHGLYNLLSLGILLALGLVMFFATKIAPSLANLLPSL